MTRSMAAVMARPSFADRHARFGRLIAKRSDPRPNRQRWSNSGAPANGLRPLAILEALEQVQAIIGIADGRIVHWSPGAERLYGWTAEEAIGNRAGDLLTQGNAGETEESAAEPDRRGVWNGEFRRTHKDGRVLAIAAHRLSHRDPGGRVTIIELDNLIGGAEHTADPQPARVRRTEANDCPTRRLAHDFNNLLGIITLNLELARKRAGDGGVREMIDEALDAAWQGAELTGRLADLARRQPV